MEWEKFRQINVNWYKLRWIQFFGDRFELFFGLCCNDWDKIKRPSRPEKNRWYWGQIELNLDWLRFVWIKTNRYPSEIEFERVCNKRTISKFPLWANMRHKWKNDWQKIVAWTGQQFCQESDILCVVPHLKTSGHSHPIFQQITWCQPMN